MSNDNRPAAMTTWGTAAFVILLAIGIALDILCE